jgi:hypothetical protein
MSDDAATPNLPGIPGGEPQRTTPRTRLWLELSASIVLTVVLATLAIEFVDLAAGAHSSGRSGQIVGTAVCLGLIYLCSRWAINVEHRLRAHTPEAQALTAPSPPATTSRRRPVRRRRYGPRAMAIATVVFALIGIGFGVGAFFAHRSAAKSSYVQDHGIRASGTVDSVDNSEACGRYSCDWTASIVVTLSSPVDGVRTTTVHYPDFSSLNAGEPVVVLIDPKQPGYAELPGSTFSEPIQWIILALFALLGLVLTAFEARALGILLKRRRQLRAQGGLTPAAEPEPAVAASLSKR